MILDVVLSHLESYLDTMGSSSMDSPLTSKAATMHSVTATLYISDTGPELPSHTHTDARESSALGYRRKCCTPQSRHRLPFADLYPQQAENTGNGRW